MSSGFDWIYPDFYAVVLCEIKGMVISKLLCASANLDKGESQSNLKAGQFMGVRYGAPAAKLVHVLICEPQAGAVKAVD